MAHLSLGKPIPDFSADSSAGRIDSFHAWMGSSWTILFSHPRDFTPVCTTELAEVAKLSPFWEEHGVKVIAMSCDSVDSHDAWLADIAAYGGIPINYPIIADPERTLAVQLDMLDAVEKDALGVPMTVRKVFIIDPAKLIRLTITYPPGVGRNFEEIKRCVKALQLASRFPIATPVNWCPGDKVMVLPSVSAEDAATRFPEHVVHAVPSGKGYIRLTPPPA